MYQALIYNIRLEFSIKTRNKFEFAWHKRSDINACVSLSCVKSEEMTSSCLAEVHYNKLQDTG